MELILKIIYGLLQLLFGGSARLEPPRLSTPDSQLSAESVTQSRAADASRVSQPRWSDPAAVILFVGLLTCAAPYKLTTMLYDAMVSWPCRIPCPPADSYDGIE